MAYKLDLPVGMRLKDSVNPIAFLFRASGFTWTTLEIQFTYLVEPSGEPLPQFLDESLREASKLAINASIAPYFQIGEIRSFRR